MIPVSVIVLTKNEERNLPQTLPPLVKAFSEVFVVDSNSTDQTQQIAKSLGARVVNFTWNQQYPKKKQWAMNTLPLSHQWVFLCDADEIITPDFIRECQHLDWNKDAYFVSSKMTWNGRTLQHGQRNCKLCLFKKDHFFHPVVDDLNINGGWEVEGHYQPIPSVTKPNIGTLKSCIIHTNTTQDWIARHRKYIEWEKGMIERNAFPNDPVWWRQCLKQWTRASYARPYLHFIHGYIFKKGFLDGRAGLDYALKRYWYNSRIVHAIQRSNF